MIQLFHPRYEVQECLDAIRPVLESGWTGNGPKCLEFEEQWCKYTGAKHALFLNSATAALHIALRLCDLPKNSKVATTSLTFVSTNAVILYEGHIPVFCDINQDTMSLSYDSALKAVEEGCKAIIWVHYGGNVSPDFYHFMQAIHDRKLDVKVIEDCAHAGGSVYAGGSMVGSRTDTYSCFSYQAVKNLPTSDSGVLCLPTKELHSRAKHLSWLGINKDTYSRVDTNDEKEIYSWQYSMSELGWKYNGNDVIAAIALTQLKYIGRDNNARDIIYRWYLEELATAPGVIPFMHQLGSSHHLMVVKSPKRDKIMQNLKSIKVATGVHYQPNHEFSIFEPYYTTPCPNVEKVAKQLLSLPNHLRLRQKDIKEICAVIKDV